MDVKKVKNMSVRELIRALKSCSDPDAYVVVHGGQWINMVDGIKPRMERATVEIVLGPRRAY